MRKARAAQSAEERKRRIDESVRKLREEATGTDEAIDEMIKRSIQKHGA
jgi:hypothetical protein